MPGSLRVRTIRRNARFILGFAWVAPSKKDGHPKAAFHEAASGRRARGNRFELVFSRLTKKLLKATFQSGERPTHASPYVLINLVVDLQKTVNRELVDESLPNEGAHAYSWRVGYPTS